MDNEKQAQLIYVSGQGEHQIEQNEHRVEQGEADGCRWRLYCWYCWYCWNIHAKKVFHILDP